MDQLSKCLRIVGPADTKSVPTGNLDLKQTAGQGADLQDHPGNFRTGWAHNLNWQKDWRIHSALRRSRRIICITQPFEE